MNPYEPPKARVEDQDKGGAGRFAFPIVMAFLSLISCAEALILLYQTTCMSDLCWSIPLLLINSGGLLFWAFCIRNLAQD